MKTVMVPITHLEPCFQNSVGHIDYNMVKENGRKWIEWREMNVEEMEENE